MIYNLSNQLEQLYKQVALCFFSSATIITMSSDWPHI